MRDQLTYKQASLPSLKQAAHELYHNYGAMLLGYIMEVVKNRSVAEGYLTDVFSSLNINDLGKITADGQGSTYCRLQQHTRSKLTSFINAVDDCPDSPVSKISGQNKIISQMNDEQQTVFCGVHYHGKSVAILSRELNKSSDEIKQILKQSFNIIRSNRK
ncbi:sigma-70 family RNA polymerase sigma factor [Mucilaginibacter achroorhodeus]|uniref:Sigma-70 family RNA polymerase sigma factor n=1 Tax=Mucilaginibacter achroorhodeus TaxID=2599294 RepID=A0A563U287_9SPHI|nr:sigma-70 family RNA polymerase sigma factor [Mucilaginibacter achroorhodeus]TWR24859.1 sigma-70 family RNA polymerase sigma factor [Mucilaginibacter achroorhodeus]